MGPMAQDHPEEANPVTQRWLGVQGSDQGLLMARAFLRDDGNSLPPSGSRPHHWAKVLRLRTAHTEQ